MNNKWLVLIGLIVLCMGAGLLGAIATAQSVGEWYLTLQKPSWTPPSWLFAPVWNLLYVMMAVAAWRVWLKAGSGTMMMLFFVQLALNALWSFLFFAARSPLLGLIGIVILWFAIVATIIVFARKDRPAAWLMVPYLAWVSFATALNAAIWAMN